jgi:hypothetical protein
LKKVKIYRNVEKLKNLSETSGESATDEGLSEGNTVVGI